MSMRIVFMGTPEFAVTALKKLLESKYEVVGVITAPDQMAGRGKKIRMSAVKEFSLENNLNILQPNNLKDSVFIEELRNLRADIQVVVAFRMLPEIVWSMPTYGTFNLHASLLPQYRGAAPINHAIMNGETETGVTTFFVDKEIDTGKIIMQSKCKIESNDNAGSLHDKLMDLGAELIIETLQSIEKGNHNIIAQGELIINQITLKPAPKIFKEDCQLNWNNTSEIIINKIRGLSPYPAAFTYLHSESSQQSYYVKIFKARIIENNDLLISSGSILSDLKTYLYVASINGLISIEELQLEGKKRISVVEFLRGFKLAGKWSFKTLI